MIGNDEIKPQMDCRRTIAQPLHRILYIQLAADLYGSSRALLHLLAALDRTRYTPLVALPGTGPLVEHLRDLGIEPIIAPHIRVLLGQIMRSWRIVPFGLSLLPAGIAMRQIIRRYSVDLVHSNTWTTLSGAIGARLARIPHVWHIREILPDLGGLKPVLVALSLRGADRLLCISKAVASQFAGRASAEQLHVIYDGLPALFNVAADSERAALRLSYGVAPSERLVGLVGRLHPQKGQDDFLHACALLEPQLRATCHFLIVGGAQPGYERFGDDLVRLAHTLGIADRVRFLGFLANTQPTIAAMDLLVLPATRPEGLGGVLLEAMAVQVPVIATRSGGPVEVIEDGVSGLLVAPQSPSDLAYALARLLADEQLRRRMGSAGRLVVERRFNALQMAAQVQDIYHELLHVS